MEKSLCSRNSRLNRYFYRAQHGLFLKEVGKERGYKTGTMQKYNLFF